MDWPILVVWLDGRPNSELLDLLSSKGWSLESVDSLEQAQRKASRADYLAVVVEVSKSPLPEQLDALFRVRKLQPLAPVFLLGRAELDPSQILEELDLDHQQASGEQQNG